MKVEFNRNQYFMVGLILLFVGIELRLVDSFVLNEPSSKFVTEKLGSKREVAATQMFNATGMSGFVPKRTVKPPRWIGLCLIAVGAVAVLHSLALRRPS